MILRRTVKIKADKITASYSAFCRNYGDYCTPVAGSHNWNQEAVSAMAEDLRSPWRRFRDAVAGFQDEIERDLTNLTNWATEHLDERLPHSMETAFSLRQGMLHRQSMFRFDVDVCFETHLKSLEQVPLTTPFDYGGFANITIATLAFSVLLL